MKKKEKKAPSFKEMIVKTISITKGYRNTYILIIMFCLLAAIFSSLAPYFLGYATDSLYKSLKLNTGFNVPYIVKILLIVLSCYVIDAVCTYMKSYLSSKVGQEIGYDLRQKLINKINVTKLRTIDGMKKGDIISKITNDVERLTDNITEIIPELVYNVSLIIGVIIMMLILDVKLALLTIIAIPVTYILLSFVVKRTQKYFELNQSAIGNVNSFVEESVTNNDVIKSFNKEKYFNKRFDKVSSELADYGFKSSFYSSLAVPFNKMIGNLNYIVIVCIGSINVIKGNMRIGAIQSFIQYMKDFNRPMNVIAQVIANLQMAIASVDRINEILALPEEENGTIKEFTFNNSIEFKNVTFGYVEGKKVLNNFNLKINKGEKIALVGKTGAGKTTIVNLLMKFYEVNSGEIKIDNMPISNLTRENIHDLFIMVLQDTWLFEGTIRDNIKFNKDNVTDEEIWNALKVVGVDHFVKSLPKTLDYKLGDNESISAGQKQLLTIARGMIKDSPFLILDEATSSVDTRTEELVQEAMDKLTEGRTSFIIAHRLSTIKNADLILVMKDGNIIETGNHDELIKQNGFYAELYNSQFQN